MGDRGGVGAAVGETVILLTLPLQADRNTHYRERKVQQNDSLADG